MLDFIFSIIEIGILVLAVVYLVPLLFVLIFGNDSNSKISSGRDSRSEERPSHSPSVPQNHKSNLESAKSSIKSNSDTTSSSNNEVKSSKWPDEIKPVSEAPASRNVAPSTPSAKEKSSSSSHEVDPLQYLAKKNSSTETYSAPIFANHHWEEEDSIYSDEPKGEIQQYLESKGIFVLYHFTVEENLPSIARTNGLLSWKRCFSKGIAYKGGGDELSRRLDRRDGLDDYVRLSFCSDHPMKWRLEQQGHSLFLFQIDPKVLDQPGVLFSTTNATKNSAIVEKGLKGLQNINLNATQRHYVSRRDPDFDAHQAEVLVPGFVDIKYIKNFPDSLLPFEKVSQQNYSRYTNLALEEDIPF